MKLGKITGLVLIASSVGYLYLTLYRGTGSNIPWLLYVMGLLGGGGLFLFTKKI